MELPDEYITRQAKQFGEALRAKDFKRAEQLRKHLVAETSTSPEENKRLEELTTVLAAIQVTITLEAEGDHAGAELVRTFVADVYPPEAIRYGSAMAMIASAAQTGTITRFEHERMCQALRDAGIWDEYSSLVARMRITD